MVVLHGDIYYGNILDFRLQGWLAIDPKRLRGERGFNYANLFCNPDRETALLLDRFERQVDVVTETAGFLERKWRLQWIVACLGGIILWLLGDGVTSEIDFNVAELALAEWVRISTTT